jgi:lipoprotein signal peptidase
MSKLSCDYIFSNYISVSLFVLISVVLLGAFVYAFLKSTGRSRAGNVGLVLLCVGAGINLIERLGSGCVRDYISFFGLFSFNIQDFLVTVGIILLIWTIWKKN